MNENIDRLDVAIDHVSRRLVAEDASRALRAAVVSEIGGARRDVHGSWRHWAGWIGAAAALGMGVLFWNPGPDIEPARSSIRQSAAPPGRATNAVSAGGERDLSQAPPLQGPGAKPPEPLSLAGARALAEPRRESHALTAALVNMPAIEEIEPPDAIDVRSIDQSPVQVEEIVMGTLEVRVIELTSLEVGSSEIGQRP